MRKTVNVCGKRKLRLVETSWDDRESLSKKLTDWGNVEMNWDDMR